jgi:hypothetical protein
MTNIDQLRKDVQALSPDDLVVGILLQRKQIDMLNQDVTALKGERGVLRELLVQALNVIETIDDEESDEWMMLMALKSKIEAAINGVQV